MKPSQKQNKKSKKRFAVSTKAKIKLESASTYSPLNRPIAEIPEVSFGFLQNELLDWIFGIPYIAKQDANYSPDSRLKYDCYPPEAFEKYPTINWEKSLDLEDFFIQSLSEMKDVGIKPIDFQYFLVKILNSIRNKPSDLIANYAQRKSISAILQGNDFKGEVICIDQLINLVEGWVKNKKKQLIPEMVHVRDHCHLMSYSLQKVEALDPPIKENTYYEFKFSKNTSDNFSKALIEVLSERKAFLINSSIPLMLEAKRDGKEKMQPTATKEKCIEILRQLGYEDKEISGEVKFGIADLLILFSELKRAKIIDKDIKSSNLALALCILSGYKFNEMYNRTSMEGKDINELYKGSTPAAIQSKLNGIAKALKEIILNIEDRKKTQ